MGYKAVTFNMSTDLHNELKMFVGNKQMSKFVSLAVEEKLKKLEQDLKNSYLEAKQDKSRNKELNDWSITDIEGWK